MEQSEWLRHIGGLLERERICGLIEAHKMVDTAAGFLAVCACGEPFDDYRDHILAVINNTVRENDWA